MYQAVVLRIKNVRKHPNADRVLLGTCQGNQVVVGLNTTEDELGVYFPSDGVLSASFCSINNLYRHAELNKDINASPGMFETSGRVRTQKFRGEISDGFFVPLSYFSYLSKSEQGLLKEGFEFENIGKHQICSKYMNKETLRMAREIKAKSAKTAKSSVMFKEHFETSHFGANLHKFSKGQWIIVTEKLHGCVAGDTLVETLEIGKISIKEIVEKKLRVRIKAMDTLTNEIVYVPIDDYYFLPNDGDWYEIELENGIKLLITGNNPIWLPELNCYRKVEELEGNETITFD